MKILSLIVLILIFSLPLFAEEGQILSSVEIMAAAEEYIAGQTNVPRDSLLIKCRSPLRDEHLPSGKVDIQLKSAAGLKFYGFTPVEIIILIEGRPYKSFMAYFDIDFKEKAYMAKRWIKRHEPMSPDNIVLVESYRSRIPRDAVSACKDLNGKVARVAIPKGRIIASSLLADAPYIKNRDLVNVILETDNLRVTSKAQAMSDAQQGDLLKLRFPGSKKEAYGRVIDEKTVLLEIAD